MSKTYLIEYLRYVPCSEGCLLLVRGAVSMPWEKVVFESEIKPEQFKIVYKIYYKISNFDSNEADVVEIYKVPYRNYPYGDVSVISLAVWYEHGETCLRITKVRDEFNVAGGKNIVYLCVNDYSYEKPQFFYVSEIEKIKDGESLKKYLELIEEHVGLAIDKIYESMMP